MNENIEKVLAVLDGFRMSDEMTYSAYSILHDEISMLDDLLKAHVMTPEEVVQIEENGVIWEELRRKGTCLPMIRYGNTFEGEDYLSISEVIDSDDYLKEYRCWTSLPTNEQREAVKWNE